MKKISIKTCLLLINIGLYAQIKPLSSSDIFHELKKLNTTGSVLYIAAHPDDENTRLLAYLANELHLRTAYLSLTRGDGGQNLIGQEQGIELGMIRTQELLAARNIDGALQYFTRAYDFGFSKTPEETFTKWQKDSVLADMVYIIRLFKPDIIITRFATDGSGGHGHHTASALLAEEAFDAASNPEKFSWQIPLVGTWQAKRLYWNVSIRFSNPNADMSPYIPLNVGLYNSLLGKSYGEIAAQSRSMHRSQGFGSAMQRGDYFEYFKPIKGDTSKLNSIFESLDISLNRFSSLKDFKNKLNKIIKNYHIEKPENSLEDLLQLKLILQKLQTDNSIPKPLYDWLCDKTDNIILLCAGIYHEAVANKFYTCKNDTLNIQLNIIKRSATKHKIVLKSHAMLYDKNKNIDQALPFNDWYKFTYKSKVNSTQISEMPWVRNGINNNLFGNFKTNYNEIEDSFSRFVTATYVINEKYIIKKNIPLIYKWVEPDKGELQRDVLVCPPVIINVSKEQLLFGKKESKNVTFRFSSLKDHITFTPCFETDGKFSIKSINGDVYKNLKTGIVMNDYTLYKSGDFYEITLSVEPNINTKTNSILNAYVLINGEKYDMGLKEIRYNHIPIQTLFPKASVKINYENIETKSKNIGYITGAGDGVAEVLRQLGYKVFEINEDFWITGDLSFFDAVIIGVRAYNTSEVLFKQKNKILDYIKNGGNVIVQYQTNNFFGPLSQNIGPYPFKISRNRITDENAIIKILQPEHSVFLKPNKITNADFEDWVQERSIYHATAWDEQFNALLSIADPNEKLDEGALIVCKHGKGNYIYTGLSFFRQMPAGNTGAIKLMVNMIELGK